MLESGGKNKLPGKPDGTNSICGGKALVSISGREPCQVYWILCQTPIAQVRCCLQLVGDIFRFDSCVAEPPLQVNACIIFLASPSCLVWKMPDEPRLVRTWIKDAMHVCALVNVKDVFINNSCDGQ